MSPFITVRSPAASARRWLALAALCTAALSAPLAASAQPTATPRHVAYEKGRETLDQRISSMHAALKITLPEEADWTKVADVMRRNDADMQKMVAERQARPHHLSAVEDLKTYERFTQAHVDGLKDLISSFETLYAEMPADQKAIADHVFATFGHERAQARHALRSNS
jgi:hypothetical protein